LSGYIFGTLVSLHFVVNCMILFMVYCLVLQSSTVVSIR